MLSLPLNLGILALAMVALFVLWHYKSIGIDIAKFSADPSIPVLKKLYHQRLLEIQDVDNVLNRDIKLGDNNIENIKLLDIETNYAKPDLQELPASFQKQISKKELQLIKKRMKPGTDLVYNDSGIFYWDIIFATEPTPVSFAYNPKKYISEHPTEFPSYEIYKNNHHFMQKEQRIPV